MIEDAPPSPAPGGIEGGRLPAAARSSQRVDRFQALGPCSFRHASAYPVMNRKVAASMQTKKTEYGLGGSPKRDHVTKAVWKTPTPTLSHRFHVSGDRAQG
jgi:hypothetical protein